MTVAFLTRDFSPGTSPPIPGGCAYYRCFLPMQAVGVPAQMGFPAWTGADGFGLMASRDRANFGYTTVVMKQLMERSLPYQIKAAQKLRQRVIVDVDDHYDALPESNQAFHITSPDFSRWQNRDIYREVIMLADDVVVTTPELFEHYSRLRGNVRIIRNAVLLDEFQQRKVSERKPVIGWVGGVPWRGGDLETLQAWLPDFLDEHDLMFHHSGHSDSSPSFAELSGVNPERVSTSPLVTLDNYMKTMFTFDIGIVPLNDIPFNRAKSFLKGLEYAAAGIPFVAQALPEYRLLESQGIGRTASTPEDWRWHMEALLDYEKRKKEARINRALVERFHTIQARSPEWQQLVTSQLVTSDAGVEPVVGTFAESPCGVEGAVLEVP